MTTELWMLLAAAGLQWLLIMVPASVAIVRHGLVWAFGNRAEAKETEGWVARAERADRNLKENLPLFAIVVLVAHVAQVSDATTALGAQIFVGARIAHAILYMAGIPGLRTASWAASLVGIGMIVSRIFG